MKLVDSTSYSDAGKSSPDTTNFLVDAYGIQCRQRGSSAKKAQDDPS